MHFEKWCNVELEKGKLFIDTEDCFEYLIHSKRLEIDWHTTDVKRVLKYMKAVLN